MYMRVPTCTGMAEAKMAEVVRRRGRAAAPAPPPSQRQFMPHRVQPTPAAPPGAGEEGGGVQRALFAKVAPTDSNYKSKSKAAVRGGVDGLRCRVACGFAAVKAHTLPRDFKMRMVLLSKEHHAHLAEKAKEQRDAAEEQVRLRLL